SAVIHRSGRIIDRSRAIHDDGRSDDHDAMVWIEEVGRAVAKATVWISVVRQGGRSEDEGRSGDARGAQEPEFVGLHGSLLSRIDEWKNGPTSGPVDPGRVTACKPCIGRYSQPGLVTRGHDIGIEFFRRFA